jgi:fucose 4-O-acetylase-like acetyltransferase
MLTSQRLFELCSTQVKIKYEKLQRAITQKLWRIELSFLCTAHLSEIYPPEVSCWYLISFLSYVLDKKVWKITEGNNWKKLCKVVIILVHCTPPQYDLSTYEVSSWYLKYFLRYAPDKNVGGKEGWTETISISPAAFGGGITRAPHRHGNISPNANLI